MTGCSWLIFASQCFVLGPVRVVCITDLQSQPDLLINVRSRHPKFGRFTGCRFAPAHFRSAPNAPDKYQFLCPECIRLCCIDIQSIDQPSYCLLRPGRSLVVIRCLVSGHLPLTVWSGLPRRNDQDSLRGRCPFCVRLCHRVCDLGVRGPQAVHRHTAPQRVHLRQFAITHTAICGDDRRGRIGPGKCSTQIGSRMGSSAGCWNCTASMKDCR
jgi:hypothetical protein